MQRIAIFSHNRKNLENWLTWLEQDYEVAVVTSDEALLPLLQSWQPHLFIYFDINIREPFLKSILQNIGPMPFGFFVVAHQYNLREELLAFQLEADHYILSSSPPESVRSRIHSLMQKIEIRARSSKTSNPISLPHKQEIIKYKEIVLYPDQSLLKVSGELTFITPTQFRILTAFLTHIDELLTRDWLQKNVFNDADISQRSIDAHIAKIKRAIPSLQTDIVNIYGRGYVLRGTKSEVA
ncbi:MAG: hypothetical protein A2Z20_09800 [Bdellovibrionales bacterium RBG_16_40_8]|nr:MAG: hypothetical protein A2Z20_09800 [Bdellovibrionales bacterium RBG_16_40_8]